VWTLVIITLINGGKSPPKIQELPYKTKQECLVSKRKMEVPGTIFGYCEQRNGEKNEQRTR
jgi:hypothetical protein